MIRPIIHRRARHTRLHDALTALEETHKVQTVEIPEGREVQYFQKYAHMLAERWHMKIQTRALPANRRGPGYMFITERAR